jgi:hypothetical protein
MRRWKRTAGAVAVVALFAMMSSNIPALAESLWWTPSTTWKATTGETGTFTESEMGTMTFYVRIDKPNPKDNTGVVGNTATWYYVGERRTGALSWPADNSLASLMRSYGFGNQTVRFTVSQAFKGSDGVERDSERSESISWVVPVPAPPTPTPDKPTGCIIK